MEEPQGVAPEGVVRRHRRAETPPPQPRPRAREAGAVAKPGAVADSNGGGANGGAHGVGGAASPTSKGLPAGGAQPQGGKHWPLPAYSARSQRIAIVLVTMTVALLLLLLPAAYCWLDQGRAEMADSYRYRSHSSEDNDCPVAEGGAHAPALAIGRNYVNEVVLGGTSGLLMTVATVLGGIGADIPGRGIFAMGTASLLASGVSMGATTYIVESAKEEFARSQLQEEHEEVRASPQEEIKEMVCHYRQRGILEEDAKAVAGVLSKYEDFWVEHMMAEELGIQLPRGSAAAGKSALATSASFFFCGMLPLLGLTSSIVLGRCIGPQWYRPQFSTMVALLLSAQVLVLLGIFLSRVVGSRTPISVGVMMLMNGSLASMLAFGLSQATSRFPDIEGYESEAAGVSKEPEPRSPLSGRTLSSVRGALASAGYEAWPSFRRLFLRGLCFLWMASSVVIIGMQLWKRRSYQSLRVFLYGWLTCITTGLGALPFWFVGPAAVGEGPLAVANAVASGMMLSASWDMVGEGLELCGNDSYWQVIVGLLLGVVFIRASERLHGSDHEEEDDLVALHRVFVERRHLRKAMIIFTVMFCHSAAEGVAVGVAFSRELRAEFGVYVSLLLAVHNVPEGLAVALVLVPRGVSAPLATVIAILTSVPQPLLAVAAFLFVDAFRWLVPVGLAFAAGAMVYVCLHELLAEASEKLGWSRALGVTAVSFMGMSAVIAALQDATGV